MWVKRLTHGPLSAEFITSILSTVGREDQDRHYKPTPAQLPIEFTPFYRSDRAKGYASGMGLGLAVCKRIIDAYGGSIEAESPPEGGAEFVLSLPQG